MRSVRLRLLDLLRLAAFLLLAACTHSERRTPWLSPIGEMHVTVREPLRSGESAPRLELVVRIDGKDLPYEPGIWRSGEITSDRSGHIYLADRGHNHILVFDEAGTYQSTIGQKGPGPFEFHGGWSPYSLDWLAARDELLCSDPIYRLLLFGTDGSWHREIPGYPGRPHLSVVDTTFITMGEAIPIFTEHDLSGTILRRFGRPLGPDCTPWPEVKRILTEQEEQVDSRTGEIRPTPDQMPWMATVCGDSLFVHELMHSNGYRAWRIADGRVAWELDLEIGDWEPPTLTSYISSGLDQMMRWEADRLQVACRSVVEGMEYRDGFLFVGLMLGGDGTRTEPDRARLTSPYLAPEELWEGVPIRGALEIISLTPDLVAHVPLDQAGGFYMHVTASRLLVIASEEPEPYLAIYRIEGLWGEPAADLP